MQDTEHQDNADRYMTRTEVLSILRLGRAGLQKWVRLGWFPQPIRFTPTTIRWRRDAVMAWLEEREREAMEKQEVAA